jgi:hypothetical protein
LSFNAQCKTFKHHAEMLKYRVFDKAMKLPINNELTHISEIECRVYNHLLQCVHNSQECAYIWGLSCKLSNRIENRSFTVQYEYLHQGRIRGERSNRIGSHRFINSRVPMKVSAKIVIETSAVCDLGLDQIIGKGPKKSVLVITNRAKLSLLAFAS